MAKKKLKKSQKTMILGTVGKAIGLLVATVGIMVGFALLSSAFPLSMGIMIGGMVLGVASITFGIQMEEKSVKESEQEARHRNRASAYVVEDFEMSKQEEKDATITNQLGAITVEPQKDDESSNELTLNK